uniref:C3H1-type domain-containing protein n=1 Tax=Elaeophora elaphi TaxID=1147741 RepID=A0A0R3S415_9BILA
MTFMWGEFLVGSTDCCRCQYAHGEEERRPVSRHPKYKTEFCQPFHQVGYCPYGPRCNFIHNEEQPPQSSLHSRRNQINWSVKVYHLNWPSPSTITTTAGATSLVTQPLLDSALFNDLLELTIDEKKKKKAIITKTVSESAVTCSSSGRLPVFAQLSNPSSAS